MFAMIRYGFNIKTRTGQRVENISIMAATQDDAERRLRQMYHHCEIIECCTQCVPRRVDTLDVEGVIELISGSVQFAAANDAAPAAFRLRNKAGTH
jgi:hypothetical protein